MKKFFILTLISVLFLSPSCVDFEEIDVVVPETPETGGYKMKFSSSVVVTNDTAYGAINQEILCFATDSLDNIVASQIDFGDGTLDGGTQVLHRYKTVGIYNLKMTIVGKNVVLSKVVKITAPSTSVAETIIQLSGNTVGDSAAIKLLLLKSKIYSHNKAGGKYFIKGDFNNWKAAVEASDTNFIQNGERYLLFNIKVKNYAWTDFGYYKVDYSGQDHWGYDPTNKYWNKDLGLYRFYTSGGQIYATQLTAEMPGACGDTPTSADGACIRLDYQTSGTKSDSLVIYANRNYLTTTDSTKIGISYSVDGGAIVIKRANFLKNNSKYAFIKVPVTKSSTVRFKTYKDVVALSVGEMKTSIFYNAGTGDCYLTIAGSMQKASSSDRNSENSGIFAIAANGDRIRF